MFTDQILSEPVVVFSLIIKELQDRDRNNSLKPVSQNSSTNRKDRLDIIFPILFTVCNLTLWTLYIKQILEGWKGREKKADWLGTPSPKELHGGEITGFPLYFI